MKQKLQIEVCLTPAVFEKYQNPDSNVVVIDILRATSAICTAFMNGVDTLIPVRTLDEAKAMKEQGYLVAAERDGLVKDFADFGNSPFNFSKERVQGNTIVYSTTNGTNAIQMAGTCNEVLIGSFLNLSALEQYLVKDNRDVVLLCAAWKDKFNLEDTVFAGALAARLLNQANFSTICDSTHASVDLWNIAKNDLVGYVEKAAQRERLRINNLDDVIPYCHTLDLTDTIPFLKDGKLKLLT